MLNSRLEMIDFMYNLFLSYSKFEVTLSIQLSLITSMLSSVIPFLLNYQLIGIPFEIDLCTKYHKMILGTALHFNRH